MGVGGCDNGGVGGGVVPVSPSCQYRYRIVDV